MTELPLCDHRAKRELGNWCDFSGTNAGQGGYVAESHCHHCTVPHVTTAEGYTPAKGGRKPPNHVREFNAVDVCRHLGARLTKEEADAKMEQLLARGIPCRTCSGVPVAFSCSHEQIQLTDRVKCRACKAWEPGQRIEFQRSPLGGALLPTRAGVIGPYILTIAKRATELQDTLYRWQLTDWPGVPGVILQPPGIQPGWRATSANSRAMLRQAIEDNVDYMLFLEDDIGFNLHLAHNLATWQKLQAGEIDLATLYTPNWLNDPFTGGQVDPVGRWRVCRPMAGSFPSERIWGSQAYVFSKKFIHYLEKHWTKATGGQDARVVKLAARGGFVNYYHHPCDLVEHYHPASGSNFSSPSHYSKYFDKAYKAKD